VGRWPQAPELAGLRDATAEREVGQVLDLVRGIRNARAEARIQPAEWLDAQLAAPGELNQVLSDLRPAIERLARVKATVLPGEAAAHAAKDQLVVVAGPLQASLVPHADPETADRERARLEKELAQAEAALASARALLADPAFIERAPAQVVDGARAREAELSDRVARLSASRR
jgi:valyl-tRNA synthetase